ncbi:beta-lactamase/transpeptidase-like protein [Phaeosphaeria sp. MPI-PUGE-AT-0046c]|nr:beta-lactamase/transpeptidase-like protein [Phaeosphaeria sp. MPI-PUGE-AT-0046c]
MSTSFLPTQPKPATRVMDYKSAEFDKFVQDRMDEYQVTGLSVAVIQDDDIHAKGYGYATLSDEKVTTDTIFDMASTSKCTTAAAVALLVQDDQYPDVQWTTPVSKLLPDDFTLADPHLTDEITIEDILSHRSGLAYHDDSYLSVRSKNPDNAKSLTRNLRNLEFVKPLRTTFMYCNIMYSVATHLVETVTGIPYAEYLRTKIWEPLGMTNTFHDIDDIKAHDAMSHKATGYHWNKETESHIAMPTYIQPEGQGAGCIFSSAGDYAKWIRSLLKRSAPLSEDTHKDLVQPRSFYSLDDEDKIPFSSYPLYALGLVIESYRGHSLITHSGGVPGFESVVAYMPEHDWGLVCVGNTDNASYVIQTLMSTLIDDVLGVPNDERIDWSAFYRGWKDKEDKEDDEIKPEHTKPENPEPLGVPIEELVGTYYDAGYKNLVLEMKDGRLVADCDDRCFPFVLTFEHLTGCKFLVHNRASWSGDIRKWLGEVRIDGGKVTAVGVEFETEVNGHLIWFNRVE